MRRALRQRGDSEVWELQNGDRLTREEFHRAYEQTPKGFRAELIRGVVHVSSPLNLQHSDFHISLCTLSGVYQSETPGIEAGANATILLGFEGEPQPDISVRILPEYGGQSLTTKNDYVDGPPEMITEIAASSRSIDLHAKREDYTRYGVLEYLVLTLREKRLRWFDLQTEEERQPGRDGIIRLQTLPGFWIDTDALIKNNLRRLLGVLHQGIASKAHAEFVEKLRKQHRAERKRREG